MDNVSFAWDTDVNTKNAALCHTKQWKRRMDKKEKVASRNNESYGDKRAAFRCFLVVKYAEVSFAVKVPIPT